MDSKKLAALTFLRQYFLVILFAFLGFLFVGIGLYQTFSTPKEEVVFEEEEKAEIFVDVSGAVISPGVYSLTSGARIQDAVIAAGGLSADADRASIARSMNMASEVLDGAKIYIPFEGENVSDTAITEGLSGNTLSVNDGLIDINSATQGELDSLPGVGPVTIDKIVAGRPYTSVDELLSKEVLRQATYNKIKELVKVN